MAAPFWAVASCLTFSRTMPRGRLWRAMRSISKKSSPLGSAKPLRRPIIENGLAGESGEEQVVVGDVVGGNLGDVAGGGYAEVVLVGFAGVGVDVGGEHDLVA